MNVRAGGICGLLAFVTANVGWIAGGLAQPSAYSFANDDMSAIGDGAAVRAATVVLVAWIAFVGAQLLRKAPPAPAQP